MTDILILAGIATFNYLFFQLYPPFGSKTPML
jgi:hypothetical protein